MSDNGIGIPRDVLPKLFEPYTQVDTSLGRSRGGLGIGLTLSRKLATMHGGAITIASDGPGQGSVFTVRLPMAQTTREGTPEPRS